MQKITGITISVVLAIALGVSVMFSWETHQTNIALDTNAKSNLMFGWGLIRQAEHLRQQGKIKLASLDAYEGIGYLQASSSSLDRIGIHGVYGIATCLNQSLYSLLGYTNPRNPIPDSVATKRHYQTIVDCFINAFTPLQNVPFIKLSDNQLQAALNKVVLKMTPEERQVFQGWS